MGFPDRRPPRRARYQDAIDWIAENDDTEWLRDDPHDVIPSVTASLVAVSADLRKALRKHAKQ